MFAPEEVKSIDRAISESGQDKSKWIRQAVSEKVERQKTKAFIESLCQHLEPDEWPDDLGATVTADDLPPSTGQFLLGSKLAGQGHFRPTDGSTLDKFPSRGAILKVSGRNERLLVTNIQRCLTCSRRSYHLWFEAV
jgi:hypothetical protein